VLKIVNVVAVAVRAEVKVGTFSTTEENSSDSSFFTAVANDVWMTYANLCVVNDDEVVLTLVTDAVVGSVT
jgi:hypothetical protein